MIVTCPSCSSKYRVRDEFVPPEGAQLECPECATLFVAHRPKHSDTELGEALARATRARDAAEQAHAALRDQLEFARAEAARAREGLEADVARHRAEAEALHPRLARLEEEVQHITGELGRAQAEGAALRAENETLREAARDARSEGAEAREHCATLREEGEHLREQLAKLQQELARPKAQRPDEGLLAKLAWLKEQLTDAEESIGRLTAELETARGARQQQGELMPPGDGGAAAAPTPAQSADPELARLKALAAGVAPMLWGLDQAIRRLSPLAEQEAELAAHIRHLQLLAGLLKRLSEEPPTP